ncbi:MAG: hypothetical protein U0470_10405 [Anaerolineae bacterium]
MREALGLEVRQQALRVVHRKPEALGGVRGGDVALRRVIHCIETPQIVRQVDQVLRPDAGARFGSVHRRLHAGEQVVRRFGGHQYSSGIGIGAGCGLHVWHHSAFDTAIALGVFACPRRPST